MPNLNYRAWWLALGWLLVTLVIYLSLMPQPPQPLNFDNGDKLEHASAYGLQMAWFCQIYWSRGQRVRIAVALICMGVTLEILQGMTGYRTFDELKYAFADCWGSDPATALLNALFPPSPANVWPVS